METTLAAQDVVSFMRDLSVIIIAWVLGSLRAVWFKDRYSLREKLTLFVAITGGVSFLCFTILLYAETANIIIVMRAHPIWGTLIFALSLITVAAAAIAGIRHHRESQKLYGIAEADLPTPGGGSAFVRKAALGFATWVASWGIAIYWLWRISVSG